MEFKQLKYFIEVAKREHLSEAALELNIAQSAISRQISQLEEELNIKLFRREGRNIYLTEAGQRLMTQATKIVEQTEQTLNMFRHEQEAEAKRIKIGYVESYVSQLLTLLIQKFEKEHATTLLPMQQPNEMLIKSILNRDLDVAFVDLTAELKKYNEIEIIPLFEENYQLYVPKQDPLTATVNPPLKQLNTQPIFLLADLPQQLIHHLENTAKCTTYRISTERLAYYLLKHNRGYLITPHYMMLPESEHFVRLSLAHTELKRTLCTIVRKDNHKLELTALLKEITTLLSHTSVYH
ncbi:glutamate biosynthesis transcriptional regulator GltC [Staphylococcus simulans]|uniref:glutamate biosynthesis transcriptional regulator GltC n=1 Tax=Staphylococcus simulans TaxID=1286 RepID=UPI00399973C8